jgi:hypothetical protein
MKCRSEKVQYWKKENSFYGAARRQGVPTKAQDYGAKSIMFDDYWGVNTAPADFGGCQGKGR